MKYLLMSLGLSAAVASVCAIDNTKTLFVIDQGKDGVKATNILKAEHDTNSDTHSEKQ